VSAPRTDGVKRTQAQSVADQMDCDLDNFVRRALAQAQRDPEAKILWGKVAARLDSVRGLVRQRMHPADREVTQ
jgi:hypothetical protein